jgi:hypothetical protein
MTTAKLIGLLNWAPQDPKLPDLWQLEDTYGFLTSKNLLIICIPWIRTDGASIPKWLWPILGHPFDTKNKFWAVIHDSGYNRWCIIIDMNHPSIKTATPETLLHLYSFVPLAHIDPKTISRREWDSIAIEVMQVMKEPRWKQASVYSAIRIFGRLDASKVISNTDVNNEVKITVQKAL